MMKHFSTILIILLATVCFQLTAQTPADDSCAIKRILLEMAGQYPEAQLADVYKSFYQDMFGPGHLLADSLAARRYLRSEVDALTDSFTGPLFEPAGLDGNYIRVNVGVITDGRIPFDDYMSAFSASLEPDRKAPTPQEWRQRWAAVEKCIAELGLQYPDEAADREMIAQRLDSGNFTVHHSDRYNRTYDFHYRIIDRNVFLHSILPRLK